MLAFGQKLVHNIHFRDHMANKIPVQVYRFGVHIDIGYIQGYTKTFVKINGLYFHRSLYVFISRPGY